MIDILCVLGILFLLIAGVLFSFAASLFTVPFVIALIVGSGFALVAVVIGIVLRPRSQTRSDHAP